MAMPAKTSTPDNPRAEVPHYHGRMRSRERFQNAGPEIAAPLGISMHDHIIVGKNGHTSLKGLRLI
jgi:DNA repair protein RadC